MNPGEGERSYAQNSSLQSEVQTITKMVVQQAVLELYLSGQGENIGSNGKKTKKVIRIADLGCAFGPNAWKVATDVVDTVVTKCQEVDQLCLPEFQVFLNDLPTNDFNTVFRSLPGTFRRDKVRCYIAGVPGSFYERLFPNGSIDFFHSSTSIHWLSQVPMELQGDYGSRVNSDNIYISQSSPQVVIDAYRMQFQRDFEKFLRCRSEEIVANGRMVLIWMGRRNSDVAAENYHIFWGLLARTLNDMAAQGLVEKEKVIKFNVPFYYPCLEEVTDIVEREGSFSIKFMDVIDMDMVAYQKRKCSSSNNGFDHECHSGARNIARHVRAVVESLMATLVGEDLIDDLFRRYERSVREYCLLNEEALLSNLIVSLQREA